MRPCLRLALLSVFVAFPLLAQSVDVPLRNWTVPPYTQSAAGGGIATMTDITGPRAFVAIEPCRIADTRGNGFSGQAGPPALTMAPRNFLVGGTVPGIPAPCGIPAGGTAAVSVQFTIVSPSAAGNLVAWPGAPPTPSVSVLSWSAGITALGNGTTWSTESAGHIGTRGRSSRTTRFSFRGRRRSGCRTISRSS